MIYGGIFDYDSKSHRLDELNRLLEDPSLWSNPDQAQKLGKEKKILDDIVNNIKTIHVQLKSCGELLELAITENDEETLRSIAQDLNPIEEIINQLEFRRMFSNELDPSNCFLDIQSGAGGTESQDWAEMLRRMYLRYCERKKFDIQILEKSFGEVAGIKALSKNFGDYAYGTLGQKLAFIAWFENPFDSNAKRHTSFASVFVYPEIDESITVDINPSDLRIDAIERAEPAVNMLIEQTLLSE